MGKIFWRHGQECLGKDTIYKKLHSRMPELKTVTIIPPDPYGTGNTMGGIFVDLYLEQCRLKKKLIECRTYDTVYSPWSYFTVDDGQIDLEQGNYLVMGTLESYEKMRRFYGTAALVPLYIHVEDGLRLRRALEREEQQSIPKYKEMCRRYLADEEDFSPEKLERCGIVVQYENVVLEDCLREIIGQIRRLCTV